MSQLQSILVICGPTGSGKTSFALSLAQHFPLEIISADSRQVYRRMNIGTAKATSEEQYAVPHHMIDLIDPNQEFSVADFIESAHLLVRSIAGRGRIPCVVGGTGLYIKALLEGLADLPSGDDELRRRLHRKEQQYGSGTLYRELQQIDPEAAAEIHPHNLVRTVRALEVCRLSGRKFSELKAQHRFSERPYRVLKFALQYQRQELYARINQRTIQMVNAGLIAEVRELADLYSFDLKALQTLGYREVVRYLKG
ncbi:MAG: tRNA (adenosine(37)-N6)-dimethylallyltransferase MiaA, partial [Desulfuromonadales bacterium]|nr:tRNA (adenosine(37)-N6)-dimethylallyltransferase MiaA [Desulfuromonadales bacterium]